MSIGIWQIVIIAVVIVLLFGRGKISELMGDVGKGIRSLKQGLNDDGDAGTAKSPQVAGKPASPDATPEAQSEASAKEPDTQMR